MLKHTDIWYLECRTALQMPCHTPSHPSTQIMLNSSLAYWPSTAYYVYIYYFIFHFRGTVCICFVQIHHSKIFSNGKAHQESFGIFFLSKWNEHLVVQIILVNMSFFRIFSTISSDSVLIVGLFENSICFCLLLFTVSGLGIIFF